MKTIITLKKATDNDFDRLTQFYRDAILRTKNMDIYARWIYGLHPTDEMLRQYIRAEAMYFCEDDGGVLSAVAVTDNQGEDYHGIDWGLTLEDNEAAVVHILCVRPDMQNRGIAGETMRAVIDLSRQLGKKALRLDALTGNTPACHLYESLGFCKRGEERWHTDNVDWADFCLFEYIL